MTTNTISELAKAAKTWPDEDQLELADYARVIETRRTGIYRINDAEHFAIAAALAEANRGEFVDEANMLSKGRSYRI
jgi:predicted transcriptional regulator